MVEIVLTVPLPPVSLRANSRKFWALKNRDADAYSFLVIEAAGPVGGLPWEKADVHYEWRYCGVEPDHGNLGGNVKYLQDILCMAPKSKAGANRWYLGLVEDDKGIHATYEAVKVSKKADECVIVKLRQR